MLTVESRFFDLLEVVLAFLVLIAFIFYVRQSVVGKVGVITKSYGPFGKIKINGMTWDASSEDETPLVEGEPVFVKRMSGLQQAIVAQRPVSSSEEITAQSQSARGFRVFAGVLAIEVVARAFIKLSQGGGWNAVAFLPFVLVLGLLALGVLSPGSRGLKIAVGLSAVACALMWLMASL